MTISSGGYNIPIPPSIYGQETAAQHDLQNQADIGRGNVMIVPQSQQDQIPFTKMGERTTWNYKSESGHPSLLPMGALRGAGPEFAVRDEGWEAEYQLLYEQLPEDVKTMLEADPSLAATVQFVLELAAKGIDWQESAEKLMSTENAANRAKSNELFSNTTFGAALSTGDELFTVASDYLEKMDPNDPHYDEMRGFVLTVQGFLHEVSP